MLARMLECLLADEAAKTDLGQRMRDDMLLRFESLRGYPRRAWRVRMPL